MSKKPRTAIVPTREENFPEWYQQVIKSADMAENSPVRGCMIIKPYGFALWENMQRIFDGMIKDAGVQNAYFPLLIPLSFMAKEAEHVDGFAKECAVVTHHRLEADEEGGLQPAGKLEEPFVIRPTSEMIIGDAMARWIQSYRDLPLKLNQWCNVMRWEMRTRLFLRTSEFLWQEGHNAFETAEEAREDALKMLESYRHFAEDYLALPVITGEKTADERFPGAIATYTIEAMMQDGKALQAGTSHDLGQNFAKSIGIKFQGRDGNEAFAHTTSWGISTRLIGGMIMTHGDDDGMIMPPKVAPYQVIIIPYLNAENPDAVIDMCETLKTDLIQKGIRTKFDKEEKEEDVRASDKMWGAVKKGIPIRVEIGEREASEGKLTWVRRDLGKQTKETCLVNQFVTQAHDILNNMQNDMYERAKAFRDERITDISTLDEIGKYFANDKGGFVRLDVKVMNEKGFEDVMKTHSLTTRCMPFADDGKMVLIGKAY
ncbi:MAG: proline--tRNA ligase [Alphaproteobacteria bacterium]|nr:proline--tRNA ligase [Alphaproteobacteria bacterium]